MLSGLVGVPLGSYLAQRYRLTHPNCDPHICAVGLFISAPMVYMALYLAKINEIWCYIFIFLGEVTLNLCWSIVADILLVSIVEISSAACMRSAACITSNTIFNVTTFLMTLLSTAN